MRTNFYKDAIIYQIYPRSYLDTNEDGFGDIPGIISKLDYLKELGINCIWLSPVYDSPQVDNGYDIADYYSVYPPFGTLDDMKVLFKEAHKRGIRIIMDFVGNHTSDKHKWFLDIIKDNNSIYKDYYIIKKGKKNGKKPPNNWTGFFGEKAWEKLPNSKDEYYLHLFAKGQPDLNWDNPKLREEIKKILKFWLDLGCDGFRCDVITLISKTSDFKNGFPSPALCGHTKYINGPHLHEYLHELYTDVYANYDTLTVGETVLSTVEDAIKLATPERQELDMIFNFDHTDVDNYFGAKYFYRKFKVRRLRKAYRKWQLGLYKKGWNSLFIENHDQRRSVGRFGTSEDPKFKDLSSKCLALTYFNLQGTPFIYQGQEIGMSNAHFKNLEETKDLEIHNIWKILSKIPFISKKMKRIALDVSRDNARTPMLWDNSQYGGFSNVEPWIRCNPDKDEVNVKNALENKNSLFYFYKELIDFRKTYEVIKEGRYVELLKNDNYILAYKRVTEKEQVVVISNFSKKERKCKLLKELKDEDIAISNYDEHSDVLKPYETRLYLIK